MWAGEPTSSAGEPTTSAGGDTGDLMDGGEMGEGDETEVEGEGKEAAGDWGCSCSSALCAFLRSSRRSRAAVLASVNWSTN